MNYEEMWSKLTAHINRRLKELEVEKESLKEQEENKNNLLDRLENEVRRHELISITMFMNELILGVKNE